MSKTLIVGGEQAFIKSKWREHLESVGLELAWHWDYKRKRLPEFPPTAEAVILIQDMCSHRHRRKASSGAKKHGIPFAEVSRQWIKALPALERNGIVSQAFREPLPTNQPEGGDMNSQPNLTDSHPEFKEYLDILFLEGKEDLSEIETSLTELLYPYSITEQNREQIRLEINKRKLLGNLPEEPELSIKEEPVFSDKFLTKMKKAKEFFGSLSKSSEMRLLDYLSFFNGRQRATTPQVSKSLKKAFIGASFSPSVFSAVVVLICQKYDSTIESSRLASIYPSFSDNKTTTRVSSDMVFQYLGVSWDETLIQVPEPPKKIGRPRNGNSPKTETQTPKPKSVESVESVEPSPVPAPFDPTSLYERLDRLEAAVERMTEALEKVSQGTTTSEPPKDGGIHLSKNEILQFLLENNKLNLSLNSK